MQQKSVRSQSFHNVFIFRGPTSQNLVSQFFVSQIFISLNPFVASAAKGHTYLNKPHLKAADLFRDVRPFVNTGHERFKTIKHI